MANLSKRSERRRNRKNLTPVIAVAGILSLGTVPAWAQQSSQNKPMPSMQSSQSQQQDKMADNLINANELEDHKVVDAQNREIGNITNLFIDPQSGKVQRADIEFSSSMFGGDHKYSIAWDKLKVKEQGKDVVVTLDESIVKRVQQAGANGKVKEGDGIYSDAGRGVLGVGDSQNQQILASQLSSEQIRKIQQKLNKQGFDAGHVDGKWSSETQTAIRNFQQSKALKNHWSVNQADIGRIGIGSR